MPLLLTEKSRKAGAPWRVVFLAVPVAAAAAVPLLTHECLGQNLTKEESAPSKEVWAMPRRERGKRPGLFSTGSPMVEDAGVTVDLSTQFPEPGRYGHTHTPR